MSLVGSIFGASNEKKSAGLTSLFDETTELPEKPQHKASAPQAKKKRKEIFTKEEQQPDKKKKRKQRKTAVKETDESAAASKPADDANVATAEKAEHSSKDDAEERTVFVGNLPIDTTRKSLASMFKSCGKVESCRLRSVAASGVKIPKERAGDQVCFSEEYSMNLYEPFCPHVIFFF